MKQILTKAIVLTRTNYGEADKIITLITPDQGKVRVMAKGVRKSTSKLAGGIELFSVSELSYIPGKGEIGTLVSTRLITNYGRIVQDLPRTMLGYELIKRLHRATEDAPTPEYFELLHAALEGLNNTAVPLYLLDAWFGARLLSLAGHQPNLRSDSTGARLEADGEYLFDFDSFTLIPKLNGPIQAKHIKLLRLLFGISSPLALQQLSGAEDALPACKQIVSTMLVQFIRM